jgi:purine-binding chemotaxis protein CheW
MTYVSLLARQALHSCAAPALCPVLVCAGCNNRLQGCTFMATYRPAKAARPRDAATQQVLTFELGNAMYGFDILRVREIRGWTAVTKIPQAPADVLGILNLRGSIVPVVDLRTRFALERAEYTQVTVIIVVSVQSQSGRNEVGVVVDGVSDVLDINAADIKQPPDLGASCATDYIRGFVSAGERMTMLLDIDRLIGTEVAALSADQQGLAPAIEAA